MNLSEQNTVAPQVVELEDIFLFLEQKGKETFSKSFILNPKDYPLIFKLMIYFYQDQYHAEKYDIDLQKGLLLTGPIGCGKTSLMTLIQQLSFPAPKYQLVSSRQVALQFMESGHAAIKHYSSVTSRSPQVFCFDDLGTETTVKYFGNNTNVMAEIMLLRYDLFVQSRIPVHVTTSLSASGIEKMYGSQVRSRMREMFNLLPFSGDANDKRQ